ncbi:hypothetical protein MHTCC0001_13460 [Flavobacteriaceae bacterium MHTCC 0001]
MCHQVIAKNYNGHLAFCKSCNTYNLLFNNISIEFNEKELFAFQKFVGELEVDYWLERYDRTATKRKIPIQTLQQNLILVFNRQEFASLKDLVLQKTKKPFSQLSVLDVDYIFFLN